MPYDADVGSLSPFLRHVLLLTLGCSEAQSVDVAYVVLGPRRMHPTISTQKVQTAYVRGSNRPLHTFPVLPEHMGHEAQVCRSCRRKYATIRQTR